MSNRITAVGIGGLIALALECMLTQIASAQGFGGSFAPGGGFVGQGGSSFSGGSVGSGAAVSGAAAFGADGFSGVGAPVTLPATGIPSSSFFFGSPFLGSSGIIVQEAQAPVVIAAPVFLQPETTLERVQAFTPASRRAMGQCMQEDIARIFPAFTDNYCSGGMNKVKSAARNSGGVM